MVRKKHDVFDIIKPEIELLKKNGCSSPSLDCRLLLAHVLKLDRTVYTHENVYVTEDELKKFKELIIDRSCGKPVSRIINKRSFWKREFRLNEEALDPRQDSEILISSVLKYYTNELQKLEILDLGAGSGCLGLSILEELKSSRASFLDISKKSLEIIKINASQLNLGERCDYFQLDWNKNGWDSLLLNYRNDSKFDIILSNPPYIPTNEIKFLQKEVKEFDPLIALDGGLDGLLAYKTIFPRLKNLLNNGAKIFIEIGKGQEEMVSQIGSENNMSLLGYEKDLAGIVRALILEFK
jgi:release factor glutamine methyltransferase